MCIVLHFEMFGVRVLSSCGNRSRRPPSWCQGPVVPELILLPRRGHPVFGTLHVSQHHTTEGFCETQGFERDCLPAKETRYRHRRMGSDPDPGKPQQDLPSRCITPLLHARGRLYFPGSGDGGVTWHAIDDGMVHGLDHGSVVTLEVHLSWLLRPGSACVMAHPCLMLWGFPSWFTDARGATRWQCQLGELAL